VGEPATTSTVEASCFTPATLIGVKSGLGAEASLIDKRNIIRLVLQGVGVVVSILIAFGIDAWWDSRGEHRLEAEYLSSLRSEIHAALGEVASDLESRRRLSDQLATFFNNGPLPIDSLRALLRGASTVSNIAPPSAVLDDLVSSGRLQLLRSAELREGLMLYRQMLGKIEINEDAHRQFVNERFVPYLSDRVRLWGVVNRAVGDSRFIQTASNADLDKLQTDERFQNLLLERQRALQRGLPRVESTVEHLTRLKALLGNGS
jgi:hypothetical protein